MENLVVDSSVVIKWLHRQDESFVGQADRLLQRALSGEVSLMVPELVKYEVGNVMAVAKRLTHSQLAEALDLFYCLPLFFFSETLTLSKRSGQIAQSLKITYYDATFLALAERERAGLVTANPNHQRKVPGRRIKIVPLQDYK